MEEIDYSILFRWFVGLGLDEPIWSPTHLHEESRPAAGRRRGRARSLMRCVAQAADAALLSDEHFTVDGTQLEAWASLKSFTRRDARRPARRMIPAIRPWISGASSGPMRRTPRRPIPTRSSIRRPRGRRASCPISATCSWRIATG